MSEVYRLSTRGFRRWATWLTRACSGVWAASWSAFALAAAMGEEDWRGYAIALAFGMAVWTPTLLAWRWPRVGGAALAALGVWSLGFFDSRSAMVGLALPATALGAGFLLVGVGGAAQRAWARWRSARE
jgi:hypothetical protein